MERPVAHHRWLVPLIAGLMTLAAPGAGAETPRPEREGTLGLFGDRDPRVLYAVNTRARAVALTIDDGPEPESTREILSVLAAHDARATFFVITDRIGGQESLLREIVEAGHELGNHLTHDAPAIEIEEEDFRQHRRGAQKVLEPFGGARFFRPGSGYYDDVMLDVVEGEGLRSALGWVYPLDAQLPFSWLSKWWIRWRARPGSIIILHDGQGRGPRTAETLRGVLPKLDARGFEVVTLSELVALGEEAHATAR